MTLVSERRTESDFGAVLRLAKYRVTLAALVAVYVVLAKAGLALASIHPSATPIWPATGLALGFILVGGMRMWPAILLGSFAANATTEVANATSTSLLVTSATIAIGNTLEA